VNGSQQIRSRLAEPGRERDMLIALSKQFGLLSSLTTFVAVEHRSPMERDSGQPELRRVPVKLAAGWGGVDAAAASGVAACVAPMQSVANLVARPLPPMGASQRLYRDVAPPGSMPISPPPAMADFDADASLFEAGKTDTTQLGAGGNSGSPASPPTKKSRGILSRLRGQSQASSVAPAPAPANADPLLHLLSLQSADGSFGCDAVVEELVRAAGGNFKTWHQSVAGVLPGSVDARAAGPIVATALALILLRTQFADREALWRRAARKACREYLAQAMGLTATEVDAWLDAARKALGV
jgi:hypothetical protein